MDITGNYVYNGKPTTITQGGSTGYIAANEYGQQADVTYSSSTNTVSSVTWGLTGVISDSGVQWNNGQYWTKAGGVTTPLNQVTNTASQIVTQVGLPPTLFGFDSTTVMIVAGVALVGLMIAKSGR